jgi:predicted DNA-binding protein with PD1-like motif
MQLLTWEMQKGRYITARLDHGSDIVESITVLAEDLGISAGYFTAIGALASTEIGYYDQKTHEYKKRSVDEAVEILSCTGNISIKEGKPFVHAHAILSGANFQAFGGHLYSGKVFAAELQLFELLGSELAREHDQVTGLYLWTKQQLKDDEIEKMR